MSFQNIFGSSLQGQLRWKNHKKQYFPINGRKYTNCNKMLSWLTFIILSNPNIKKQNRVYIHNHKCWIETLKIYMCRSNGPLFKYILTSKFYKYKSCILFSFLLKNCVWTCRCHTIQRSKQRDGNTTWWISCHWHSLDSKTPGRPS